MVKYLKSTREKSWLCCQTVWAGLRSVVAQAQFISWSSVVRSQGAYRPWKVTEIKIPIFQAWKVIESGLGHVKSWKTNQKVASFSSIVLVFWPFICIILTGTILQY